MLFKKSKRKQLAEMRYKAYMIRAGLETQKEHAVSLARRVEPEDFPMVVGRIYECIIQELKELEDM